ncbi:hypothetical protein LZS85_15675 [Aliivibrio fischeri]|uniref:hypothetical protein n=1 Tax=Aliivibrio fischeri TaxID=668 RepID=UPI001F1EE89F|nr:hypothetical protein [Aliivibrio fischeri]MCE7567563.1 hypothetical protein [Aliivibrio fischeri]
MNISKTLISLSLIALLSGCQATNHKSKEEAKETNLVELPLPAVEIPPQAEEAPEPEREVIAHDSYDFLSDNGHGSSAGYVKYLNDERGGFFTFVHIDVDKKTGRKRVFISFSYADTDICSIDTSREENRLREINIKVNDEYIKMGGLCMNYGTGTNVYKVLGVNQEEEYKFFKELWISDVVTIKFLTNEAQVPVKYFEEAIVLGHKNTI